jgi:hypothetical protein
MKTSWEDFLDYGGLILIVGGVFIGYIIVASALIVGLFCQ